LAAIPGVYIFCYWTPAGWVPVYVGETDDLSRRLGDGLTDHHRLEDIKGVGATHISAVGIAGDRTRRLDVETDLRQHLNPPCNKQ
jgi:hypothetical protein